MPRKHLPIIAGRRNGPPWIRWSGVIYLLACCLPGVLLPVSAAESDSSATTNTPTPYDGLAPHYFIKEYVIEGNLPISTNITTPILSKYTGTNISIDQIGQAALDLQAACLRQGYPLVGIVIAPQRITNGVVTLNLFQGAVSQVVIAGKRYSGPATPIAAGTAAVPPAGSPTPAVAATHPTPPPVYHPPRPATPAELAAARVAMQEKLADLKAQANDHRVHVASPGTGPRFEVEHYVVLGNSVLSPGTIARTMTNIDGDYGTNVSLEGIQAAASQLQKAYRDRGYVTVAVGLPQQKLTNATVKIQVVEGRLEDIIVKGNHFFSSNNVMRALPSLHTNMILNAKVFEAELNRANANQDRQISPVISPGPEPGTSDMVLKVKDRLPLHAKVEYNNQSSPGTPDLRLNTSIVYNNLWNLEHSIGAQYSFSPGFYKDGNQWPFYDQPLVANYSAYYRMPLGTPQALEDVIDANPGSFGYDEATRKFNLPPSSGQPELNFYASRSTIDTGLTSPGATTLVDIPNVETITENTFQQDLTVNQDIGVRFGAPLAIPADFNADFFASLDYKTYQVTSSKTNSFEEAQYLVSQNGIPLPPIISTVDSPVPVTRSTLEYLPFTLHFGASKHDDLGTTALGLGMTVNTWYSGMTTTNSRASATGMKNVQAITGSSESTGHWVTLNPSLTRDFAVRPDWILTLRADGQWASEPLISNEQFGVGGVNSVRGYREGEVFGDTGWHVSLEQQTPSVLVGMVYGNTPLTLRGSVYTDYGRVFLLDPEGRQGSTPLYDVGFGGVASVGSHWQARFLFSVPLLSTPTTEADHPFFNFALTAQF